MTEAVIDRSCADVAEYAGNPDNAPEWYANIQSVEWKTEPPLAVGSRLAFVAQFLGRRLAYTYTARVGQGPPNAVGAAEVEFLEAVAEIFVQVAGEPECFALGLVGRQTSVPSDADPMIDACEKKSTTSTLTALKEPGALYVVGDVKKMSPTKLAVGVPVAQLDSPSAS